MNGLKFFSKEPKFYQRLYSKIYNGKAIKVHIGSRKLHTKFKYNKNAPANTYKSKDDQNCVFGSLEP